MFLGLKDLFFDILMVVFSMFKLFFGVLKFVWVWMNLVMRGIGWNLFFDFINDFVFWSLIYFVVFR